MRFLIILALLASPASADLLTFSMKDEIAGTENFFVLIKADNYRRIEWENAIWLTCNGDGSTTAKWHNGGHYSGWDRGPREVVTAKFDDEPPVDMTISSLVAPPFIDKIRTGSTLIVRDRGATTTSRFSLSGTSEALAVFKSQCGV
ncbi:hypothetical protein [Salipiger abyssi]|uniref:hypothetical protein n=1 Tax=Salipiger abyssi TaxID=1250539 RepID=UPI0009755F50|nr:hypothetical protein [Salipiger abyssi]